MNNNHKILYVQCIHTVSPQATYGLQSFFFSALKRKEEKKHLYMFALLQVVPLPFLDVFFFCKCLISQ